MNYRSFEDLNNTIINNLHKVPAEAELIVGIPRSGMLAANILALHLHLPFTDIDAFLQGRVIGSGERLQSQNYNISETEHVFVVDDSIRYGGAMNRAKDKLKAKQTRYKFTFGAVYINPDSIDKTDIYFEICPLPRLFEWNIMNHPYIKNACIGIDGVLCPDPTDEENDDGSNYLNFLKNAPRLLLPRVKIGTLVTNRLNKYRNETEEWLRKHGIKFDELIMRDFPDLKTRREANDYGTFKGRVYAEKENSKIFIESSYRQSIDIAKISGKPVYCVEQKTMVKPGHIPILKNKSDSLVRRIKRKLMTFT